MSEYEELKALVNKPTRAFIERLERERDMYKEFIKSISDPCMFSIPDLYERSCEVLAKGQKIRNNKEGE